MTEAKWKEGERIWFEAGKGGEGKGVRGRELEGPNESERLLTRSARRQLKEEEVKEEEEEHGRGRWSVFSIKQMAFIEVNINQGHDIPNGLFNEVTIN